MRAEIHRRMSAVGIVVSGFFVTHTETDQGFHRNRSDVMLKVDFMLASAFLRNPAPHLLLDTPHLRAGGTGKFRRVSRAFQKLLIAVWRGLAHRATHDEANSDADKFILFAILRHVRLQIGEPFHTMPM